MELEAISYRSDHTHDLIQMVAVERDHSYFLKVSDMSDDYVEVSRTRPCVNADIPAGPSNNCATASDDHESDSVEILSEFETEDIKLDVNSVVALNCNNTKSNGEVKVNEEKIPKIQDILFVDVSNLDDDDDDDFEPPVFNRSDLINEVQTDNNELVKCDFCNQSISSKNLQTHMDAVHNGVRPYKCHVCGKAFGKKKLLERHTSGVHEKIRNFLCGECQKSFTQKCDLKRHVLEVHQDFRAHKCPLCRNAYKKSSTLALHIAKVHHAENKTDDDAPTTNCTKTNAIKTAVVKVNNAQQSQSIDDKVVVVGEFYSCDECDKKYILKRALLDHVRRAHANKLVETLRCSICESSSFADGQALEAHLRSAHDQGVKPHACRHCPKAYGRRHQLKQHVEASHLGLRPHQCPECGKRFGLKLGVNRHISEVHRGLKPYSCELCPDDAGRRPSSFRQSGQLREHVDTAHRGIRRFECADCGKRFGKKPHLRVHLLTVHLGHRAHKCAHCSKAFGQIGDLKKHVDAIHRRVKPHACQQCDRSYTQKSHLTHHVNVVHFGVKPHLCPVCCKAFSSRTVMRRHFEAMHKGLVLEEMEKNRVTLEELEKCDL